MRWRLDTQIATNGFTVMIKFPSALARALTIDDEEVRPSFIGHSTADECLSCSWWPIHEYTTRWLDAEVLEE